MQNNKNTSTKYFRYHNQYYVTVYVVIGIFMILYIGSLIDSLANAQTLQEKCNPNSGINISKSNCLSNTPTHPVYNVSNTDTFTHSGK
jgi:hypothetical protein